MMIILLLNWHRGPLVFDTITLETERKKKDKRQFVENQSGISISRTTATNYNILDYNDWMDLI